ncbi:type II secretion system protein GspM [Caenimonas aquaedulcis]|uniref:Type II secretion system protein M n=1 Tax=Caenimonas aquaedulcis TaxID=2793270 RepID=A0A931H6C5_9BURK|nr:type II secretion system protein GspM [Caenimonas aquaedulcis]MBG9389353.1 type II secretion system protein M [Caenimonas aquaedulcis]
MSEATQMLKARWAGLRPREQALVAGAVVLVGLAIVWMLALAPAIKTLRTSEVQRRTLDAQLQRMQGLQAQAQALQSQPKQGFEEAMRLLEASVRERLGTTARMVATGDRVTLTLAGAAPDALAQWLTQARVNARALPGEAHLTRNASGKWDGTLVLTLPAR